MDRSYYINKLASIIKEMEDLKDDRDDQEDGYIDELYIMLCVLYLYARTDTLYDLLDINEESICTILECLEISNNRRNYGVN